MLDIRFTDLLSVRLLLLSSQINFAGEGGLYAEMIQDRSFDAMALAVGFAPGNATVPLRPPADAVEGSHHRRRLTAERLPPRSGAGSGLASLFSMPLPLGPGGSEGAPSCLQLYDPLTFLPVP